jgi:hypothetical protein
VKSAARTFAPPVIRQFARKEKARNTAFLSRLFSITRKIQFVILQLCICRPQRQFPKDATENSHPSIAIVTLAPQLPRPWRFHRPQRIELLAEARLPVRPRNGVARPGAAAGVEQDQTSPPRTCPVMTSVLGSSPPNSSAPRSPAVATASTRRRRCRRFCVRTPSSASTTPIGATSAAP